MHGIFRYRAGGLALLLAVLIGSGLYARVDWDQAGLTAGPMVQNVSGTGLSIVWWQKYGTGVLRLSGPGLVARDFLPVRSADRFEAEVTGLQPGGHYRYAIQAVEAGGARRTLGRGEVQAAKPHGEPMSFLVFADSGSGSAHQYRLADVMNNYRADVVLHAGDLLYDGTRMRDYRNKFFRPYAARLRTTPFYPILGNHDEPDATTMLHLFSLPKNGPPELPAGTCYAFDYGCARFVGIDSNLPEETLQAVVAPWIASTLAGTDVTWRVVFLHHAPIHGGHYSGSPRVRSALVPAIESGGADIVFCAHAHLYERSVPMRACIAAPTNGVVYVVTGAGGRSLHHEERPTPPYIAAYNDETYSFSWVDVSPEKLTLEQIGEDNRILDRFTLFHDDARGATNLAFAGRR